MAHEIDITNGQAAFVSAREDAWHRLGTVLPDTFTAEEAMEHGLLGGWNVRKEPLLANVGGELIPVPEKYAVVRDNPVERGRIDVLGTVGESYTVIQNEEHAGLLNALVDESGAHFETAGALQGGKRVFITMKLPGHMSIGGVDRVDQYLAAMNSHDGSSAFTFMISPVRIVCQNTLNFALGKASNVFRVRHTTGATKAIVQQAREALDLTFNFLDRFQEDAERLINTEFTRGQFEEMVEREFGAAEDAHPATVTRTENKLDEIFTLYHDSYTHEGLRDTAWAALNALTEWYDHYAPVRGAAEEADTRAHKAILYPAFKTKAYELVAREAGLLS